MDTKAAFEKWFDDEFGKSTKPEEIVVRDMVRQGWAASRVAIEIELPELAVDHDERLRVETNVEGAFNLGVTRSRQAITSHGIRIKGKTE